MAFDTSTLTKARESGYSDDEVISFAAQSDPRIKTALDSGYSIDEVASHFDPKPQKQVQPKEDTFKDDWTGFVANMQIAGNKLLQGVEGARMNQAAKWGSYAENARKAADGDPQALEAYTKDRIEQYGFAGIEKRPEKIRQDAELKERIWREEAKKIPEFASYIAEKEQRVKELTPGLSPEMTKLNEAKGKEFWKTFASNPVESLANIVASSAIVSAPAIATGAVGSLAGPAGTAAGAAMGSYAVETSQSLLDALRDSGVDIANPEQVEAAFTDPQVMEKARGFAEARGIPIAIFDAASAGVAGKFVSPLLKEGVSSTTMEVLKASGKEVLTQATAGALGEAAAEKSSGQDLSMKDIFLEAAGSVGSGVGEVVGNVLNANKVDAELQKAGLSEPPPPVEAGPITEETFTPPSEPIIPTPGTAAVPPATEAPLPTPSEEIQTPPTPPLTQGTEFVGTAINTPQGVVTREQGTAHPEMLMEALDKDMPEAEMESNLGFAFRTPDGTIEWVDRVEAGKRLVESGQLKGFKVGDKLTSEHIRGEVEGVTFSQTPTLTEGEIDNQITSQQENLIGMAVRKGYSLEDAQDFAQDVMIKATQNKGAFNPEKGPVEAWVKGIANNLFIDNARAAKAKKRDVEVVSSSVENEAGTTIEEQAKTDVGPRAELVAKESAKSIQDVVDAMPENDQKVMNAFMVDPSLTIEEMAEETGLTVDQVKKAKARGRKELEQFVRSQNIGDRMAPGASNIRELKNAQLTLASDIYEGLRQSDQLTKETFQKNVEQQYPELFTQEQVDEMWTLAGMASESFRESGGRKPMNKVIDQMTGGKMREGETSRKNEIADQQRRARGLPAAMQAARKSHQSVWDEAMRAIDYDPQLQSNTVAKFKDSNEVPTDFESAILLHATIEAENKFDDAVDRVNEAATDQDRIIAQANAQTAERELIELYDINKSTGTAAGRALSARRMMSDRSYTLSRMIAETRAKKGEDLTPQEQADVKENFEKLNKSKAELDARELQKDEEVAREQAEEVLGSMSKDADPVVKSLLDRIVDRLKKAHDAARERILARLARTSTGLDPTVLYDLSVIGAYHIAKGIKKLSDWKRAMNEDLDGAFEEHYDQVFEESNRRVDEAVEEGTKTSPKKEKVKRLLKDAPLQEVLDDTRKKMANRIKEGDSISDLRSYVQKMALALVRGGTTQLDPLLDTLHTMIEPVSPGITRREVMDLFSGYGDSKQLDMEQAKVTVRDLKGQSQQLAKIEDIPKGIPLKKTGVERRTPSDTERRLIKQVNELAKVFGIKVTDPATQLRSILSSIKTRLQNDIKDLTHQIETGEKPLPRTPAPTNQEIENLRAQKKELQEILAQMNKGGNETEILNRALKAYKARVVQRMADLQSRIAKNDFATKKRRELDLSKDAEAVKLAAEYRKQVRIFNERKFDFEVKNYNNLQRAAYYAQEVLNTAKASTGSVDFSAFGRQAAFYSASHPLQSFGNLIRSIMAMNEKQMDQQMAQIEKRPNALNGNYSAAKLFFGEMKGALSRREEQIRSNFAEKIPWIKWSNRAYNTFLNRARADMFDYMLSSAPAKPTKAQIRSIGYMVNTATGRGELEGRLAGAADALSIPFWSPRLYKSRLDALLFVPLIRRDAKGVRKVILKEYVRALSTVGTLIALGAMAGAEIEWDPESSDFLKFRFGNTRYDILGGHQQWLVYLYRMLTGRYKTTKGKQKDLGEPENITDPTFLTVTGRMMRSKLTPVLAKYVDYREGRDIGNNKIDRRLLYADSTFPYVHGMIPGAFAPLSLSNDDLAPIAQYHGYTAASLSALASMLGIGVQQYENKSTTDR